MTTSFPAIHFFKIVPFFHKSAWSDPYIKDTKWSGSGINYFRGHIEQIIFNSSYLLSQLLSWKMLRVVYLSTPISTIHPLKQCIYFRYRKSCNHPFFEVNVSFLLVVPLFVTRCHSLSFAVIRCHSLSLDVPLVVIRCHSLSLVVTRCTSRLSIYKRCSNNRPRLCTPYLSLLFFIYLQAQLRTTWNIKDVNFCSNKKWLTRTYFIQWGTHQQ